MSAYQLYIPTGLKLVNFDLSGYDSICFYHRPVDVDIIVCPLYALIYFSFTFGGLLQLRKIDSETCMSNTLIHIFAWLQLLHIHWADVSACGLLVTEDIISSVSMLC